MHFGFDDDQLALRDALRELLDKECSAEVVRAAWDAPPGQLDRTLWTKLAEMGVLATTVPVEHGGLGLDERSSVLMLEEVGRAGVPHPVVDTAAVAAPLLAEATEAAGPAGGSEPGWLIATDLGGPNIACGADADRLLLCDPTGPGLHLLDPARDGVRLERLDTVDGARRAVRVEWSPGPSTRVTDDPEVVSLAFERGALGTAAQLLGLAEQMLDMTVAYVSQREQFGQPVGAFQAVKHRLADALKELAFARPAVHRAAHSLALRAETRTRDVSMAKAMASDAARFVGRQALQCHGAIGYTIEADLHLYLKRTWALASAWGDAAWHRDRIGVALGV